MAFPTVPLHPPYFGEYNGGYDASQTPSATQAPQPASRQRAHALFVRSVSQSGRYCDGQGLYLDVRSSGSRGWIQRLTIRGRRAELGLGGFPLVSLKEAREKALRQPEAGPRGGRSPLGEAAHRVGAHLR